jgi:hypothetical protein
MLIFLIYIYACYLFCAFLIGYHWKQLKNDEQVIKQGAFISFVIAPLFLPILAIIKIYQKFRK